MDYTTPRTPGWLVGLIVVFAIACVATFGLYLYDHAQRAALSERETALRAGIAAHREEASRLDARIQQITTQVQSRQALIANLEADAKQAQGDIDRLVSTDQEAVKAISADMDKETATYKHLLSQAQDHRTQLGADEQRALQNDSDFDARRDKLRMKIEALSQDIEQLKKQGRNLDSEYDARIAQLQDRVRDLTQQRELDSKDLRSAGDLLQADGSDGFVILDRGHAQHLRLGTRFAVFNRRAGQNHIKGTIEVTKVEDQISVARILSETDANDPMVVGDHIANPIYNPNKVLSFAIRGDFTHFSTEELRRFITESGGRYDDQLTVDTDYLVAGEHSEEALQQAIKLGISILIQSQLLQTPETSSKQ
jgi:predicted  nucleic acid-binding Zn-ribbon protein